MVCTSAEMNKRGGEGGESEGVGKKRVRRWGRREGRARERVKGHD